MTLQNHRCFIGQDRPPLCIHSYICIDITYLKDNEYEDKTKVRIDNSKAMLHHKPFFNNCIIKLQLHIPVKTMPYIDNKVFRSSRHV